MHLYIYIYMNMCIQKLHLYIHINVNTNIFGLEWCIFSLSHTHCLSLYTRYGFTWASNYISAWSCSVFIAWYASKTFNVVMRWELCVCMGWCVGVGACPCRTHIHTYIHGMCVGARGCRACILVFEIVVHRDVYRIRIYVWLGGWVSVSVGGLVVRGLVGVVGWTWVGWCVFKAYKSTLFAIALHGRRFVPVKKEEELSRVKTDKRYLREKRKVRG